MLQAARVACTLLAAALLLVACGANPSTSPVPTATTAPSLVASPPITASPSPATPSPTATRSPPRTLAPTPDSSLEAVVVTIRVAGDEEYRVELIDPADIAIARQLLAGEEAPTIPNGRIVRGESSVNTGYSWHIDPSSFEWADFTTEVCDGSPSYVEDGTLSGPWFCPWSAEVVGIEPS